jgi:hypothetical protein
MTELLYSLKLVMPGLDPGIHVLAAWMAGSSPAMTGETGS